MPTVTYDGRSFMLDGRRLWLVSGSIPYARISRELWAERIHLAKLCGLNTIETPIFWNRHEPRAGKLDFTGENDLRHFVRLVQQAGLHCVLRIGPFVGAGWEMGGLPAWLADLKDVKLRAPSSSYLDACARFISAVVEQIRDLQVTSLGRGGPVVAVQCEANWSCGDDSLASEYLGELNRFLRESGLSVPILNSNNLWQTIEGQIDGWAGNEDMLATTRQLACVRADQPRLVVSFATGSPSLWGQEPAPLAEPWRIQRRLAETLAGGGQFNLDPFAGGVNLGAWAGRLSDTKAGFCAQLADHGAPVSATGSLGHAWNMTRRLCTFASKFGRVLAHLDPHYQPIALHPGEGRPAAARKGHAEDTSHAVVHTVGPQGAVVFVFAPSPASKDTPPAKLLLPEGETLPVYTGSQAVSWCLFDTNVGPRSHLDYTNLNALGVAGRVLVCFGPSRTPGIVCINGSTLQLTVPNASGAISTIEHEGMMLLVLPEEVADTAFLADDGVYVGVIGLTQDGKPVVSPDAKSYTHVSVDGVVTSRPAQGPKAVAVPQHLPAVERTTLGDWLVAGCDDYTSGESPRFAAIAGPSSLTSLGAPHGYGWYRITLKPTSASRVHAMLPQAADRLHLFLDGKPVGLLGVGPGSAPDQAFSLKKAPQHLVVFADNAGRFSDGPHLGEPKGVFGHLFQVEHLRPGKPKVTPGDPIEVLSFRSPLFELRNGDCTDPDRLTWTLSGKRKHPLIVRFAEIPVRGLLLADGKTIAYVDQAGPTHIVLEPDRFSKSAPTIQFAPINGGEPLSPEQIEAFSDAVSFWDALSVLSAKADWSFAKWEQPSAGAFKPAKASRHDGPVWWKSLFKGPKGIAPLFLDLAGLTKGQIYINGKHLSRYFIATPDGKPQPGPARVLLPHAMIRAGAENELVLFDEHGGNPSKCRLHAEPTLGSPIPPVSAGSPIVAS